MSKDNDRNRVVAALTATAEVFGKNMSPALLKIYCGDLRDYSASEVCQALETYRKQGEPFMPKPSDIIKLIDGTSNDKALAAWSMVSRSILQVGAYTSVVFPCPLIKATIKDMGGWQFMCSGTEKDTEIRGHQFLKIFAGFQRRPPTDYPNKFLGIHDQNNINGNFHEHVKAPVAIGNREQCKLVYRGGVAEALPLSRVDTDDGPKKIKPPTLAIANKDDAA